MRVVVFDIETANWMSDIGSSDPSDLTIAVVGIHDSETDRYSCFLEHELPELWKILERTDILVGYNSDHFDIPLLNKYYPGDLKKIRSLDLLKEISAVLGRRVRLDAVAEGTLGKKKIANGMQAMVWWKEGNIEKLREYCLKDVEVTKGILDHALKNGTLTFKELGIKKEIRLDTSKWLTSAAPSALTRTLGF